MTTGIDVQQLLRQGPAQQLQDKGLHQATGPNPVLQQLQRLPGPSTGQHNTGGRLQWPG